MLFTIVPQLNKTISIHLVCMCKICKNITLTRSSYIHISHKLCWRHFRTHTHTHLTDSIFRLFLLIAMNTPPAYPMCEHKKWCARNAHIFHGNPVRIRSLAEPYDLTVFMRKCFARSSLVLFLYIRVSAFCTHVAAGEKQNQTKFQKGWDLHHLSSVLFQISPDTAKRTRM